MTSGESDSRPDVAKIIPFDGGGELLAFNCPGCREIHSVPVKSGANDSRSPWRWNGNKKSPTIEPSVKCEFTSITEDGWRQWQEWMSGLRKMDNGDRLDSVEVLCHVVITAGVAHFCSDCTHEMAGKSVRLGPVGEVE